VNKASNEAIIEFQAKVGLVSGEAGS